LQTSELAELVFAPLVHGSSRRTGGQEFLAVPGDGTPRWLLPASERNIDGVLANWSPYRLGSRIKWAAIRTAHSQGWLLAMPHVASAYVSGLAEIDWRLLGWSKAVSPVPVVYVGTPGVSWKAVIHLVDPGSGACDAVVKVPLAESAKASILREADTLELLADEGCPCAPRLLHVDRQRCVSTQTAFNGKAGGRKFTAQCADALRSLMLTGESTALAGHAAEWQEQLSWAADFQPGTDTLDAALAELCDPEPLPACWIHGDFAPWNIRRLPHGCVGLVDWEEGERSGLPLQDALHFLHMQGYLFGARPATHAFQVEAFAKTLGVSPRMCHKLEVAYLAHAYIRRLAQHEAEHCKYLFEALRVVLSEKHRLSTPANSSAVLSPLAPALAGSPVRLELLTAVVAHLNAAEIPYCVLSGYENHGGKTSADVDFMFHPRDSDRIGPVLAQAARGAGARLVQAIQHETTGCYFVLAKDDGDEFGFLDPDCGSDYRRQGRLWLSAEGVLARRRRCKDIYAAAVDDEFVYYLVKKVLKQSVTECQLRRLRHLYQRDPVNCRDRMLKFWPPATARAVERLLIDCDHSRFVSSMPGLLEELKASTPRESLARRVVQQFRDAVRRVRRVLRPTGMSVLVYGGDADQRSAIALELARRLAPAFRRIASAQSPAEGRGFWSSLGCGGKVLADRCRSALVVSTASEAPCAWGWNEFVRRLRFAPDMIFILTGGDSPLAATNDRAGAGCGAVACLDGRLATKENVQLASRRILCWLAERQEKRLHLKREPSSELPARRLRKNLAEPAGLHLVK